MAIGKVRLVRAELGKQLTLERRASFEERNPVSEWVAAFARWRLPQPRVFYGRIRAGAGS